MKIKYLASYITFLVYLWLSIPAVRANHGHLFDYDKRYVRQIFAHLSLASSSGHESAFPLPEWPAGFSMQAPQSRPSENKKDFLGIPPFVIGFLLGVPGVLLVAVISRDEDQTLEALLGMFTQIYVTSAIIGCLLLHRFFCAMCKSPAVYGP